MRNLFARTLTGLLAAAALWVSTSPAHATDTPDYNIPGVQVLDPLGIDIANDFYIRNDTFLTIGGSGTAGLAWRYAGHTVNPNPWGGYQFFVFEDISNTATAHFVVHVGDGATEFDQNFNNLSGDGSTLSTSSGSFAFTTRDGVVYSYPGRTITYPDGTVLTFNVTTGSCDSTMSTCSGSIVSNRGYAFRIDAINRRIDAVNMSAHNCDAQALTCNAYDNYITLGTTTDTAGKTWQTVTDSLNNTWQYLVSGTYTKRFPDGTKDRRPPGIFGYKDPKGYFVTIARDTNACISSFTDPRGTFTWTRTFTSGSPEVITVRDPSGAILYTAGVISDAVCPGENTLKWVQNAAGNTTTYNITAIGPGIDSQRLNSVVKPEGNTISYTYDARGNVTQIANLPKSGSGLSTIYLNASYDATCANLKTCNKPNWTQDAKGNKTYYTYDPTHGGVTSVTSPADGTGVTPKAVTTFAQFTAQIRNGSGSLINAGTIWLPQTNSSCATSVTCDGTVNQLKTTTAYATYNLLPSSAIVAAGDNSVSATTTYTYDAVGNIITADGPRTDVDDISYKTYDSLRRPVYEVSVDPDGAGPLKRVVVHHVYTNVFETQSESGSGNATNGSDFVRASYVMTSYNTMGQKTLTAAYIDGNGTAQSLSQFNYDSRGRLNCSAVRMNPAVYGTISGTDACSLGATSSTYGPDRISKNIYNTTDQLTEVDQAYGVAGTQRAYARYAYTNNGLKQTEMDANGNKTMYVYDGFDRPSQIQYPSTTIGSGNVNTADYEQYGYDANNNKISWRRRDGQTIIYGYDNLNRQTLKDLPGTTTSDVYTSYDLLSHVKSNRFGSTSGSGTQYFYDGLGRLNYTTDINGRTIWYGYNQASARTQLTFPDLNNFAYGVDNANRMVSLGWNATTGLISQSYDNLGRLVGQGKSGGSTSYGYDALGRMTSMTNDFSGTTYDISWTFAFNPAGQISTSTASTTVYDYKETANSTDSPTYDGLNRDTRMVPTTSACPAGGYDARQNLVCDGLTNRVYAYDVENRLLTASGSGTGGTLTLTYDPEGRLVSYTAGGTTTTFLYDGVNLIAEYNGPSTTPLRRYAHGTGIDNPLIWLEGSGGFGDARWLYTDYQGSVIAYTGSAGTMGNWYKYGPYGEPKDAANNDSWSGSRFRYTGQLMLPEARLYYYKARVYDPKWGRYLQTDPIGSKDDLNPYAYTGGDPVNKSDSTGLFAEPGAWTTMTGDNNGASPTCNSDDCLVQVTILVNNQPAVVFDIPKLKFGPVSEETMWDTLVGITTVEASIISGNTKVSKKVDAKSSASASEQQNWITYYHGTDGASAMSIMSGGLKKSAHKSGQLGFYLTPDPSIAAVFAGNKGGDDPAVLRFNMTPEAEAALLAAGGQNRTVPFTRNGPVTLPELYLPPTTYPTFGSLVASGQIIITPLTITR